MILVCGIHGSGKTQYCNNLKLKYGINVYTASQLIDERIPLNQNKTKKIDQINRRQEVLLEKVKSLLSCEKNLILNAHLCLVNKENKIERIPLNVFQSMPITEIHLVECSSAEIRNRIYHRDEIVWDEIFINKFIERERKYAQELSELLNVNLKIADTSLNNKKNIILPIAPKYIEKILSGEKKYEYRKKLCKNDIDKIYLYSTAPIKGIVGEVKVLGKIEKSKGELWNTTSQYSGIDKQFYEEYFLNNSNACAYRLGEVTKYVSKIPLENVGIHYIIQSFAYVNDI